MGRDEALTCSSAQVKGQSVQLSPGHQTNTINITHDILCRLCDDIPCVLYCLQGWLLHEVYHKWN